MLTKLIYLFAFLIPTFSLACSTDAANTKKIFQASSEKSFQELMEDAMIVMDRDMSTPDTKTGNPDKDFLAMMIAHHQGAVDMAQALLLYAKEPELKNFAMQIITDQKNEIELMKVWQKKYAKK